MAYRYLLASPAILIALVACGTDMPITSHVSNPLDAPSRCDPEPKGLDAAEEGCVDVADPESNFAPNLTLRSWRPFRDEVCMEGTAESVPGSCNFTVVRVCLGVAHLGPVRSFTLEPIPVGQPIPEGRATLEYVRHQASSSSTLTTQSPIPSCNVDPNDLHRAVGGTIDCERGDTGIECRLRHVRLQHAQDSARETTASAWLHASPPPEPVACELPPSSCPAEADAGLGTSCIQGTGDALRPVVVMQSNVGSARDDQVCIRADYASKCNFGDGENRGEDHFIHFCLGSASPITTERTFTITGGYPEFGFPPPEGQARFVRSEVLRTTTHAGDVSDERSWVAPSGTITCAPQGAQHLACRFTDVPFEAAGGKTSSASGWVHAEVQALE
ncbi:MAG: hypothetical protein J0I07_01135 [Myxococcales bacterium]|nr:hypothetical protein [Myxococcales bacterium]